MAVKEPRHVPSAGGRPRDVGGGGRGRRVQAEPTGPRARGPDGARPSPRVQPVLQLSRWAGGERGTWPSSALCWSDDGLREARAHRGGPPSSLRSALIQRLASPRNARTETPRNEADSAHPTAQSSHHGKLTNTGAYGFLRVYITYVCINI